MNTSTTSMHDPGSPSQEREQQRPEHNRPAGLSPEAGLHAIPPDPPLEPEENRADAQPDEISGEWPTVSWP